jgi:biotin carboxyl carrier protein
MYKIKVNEKFAFDASRTDAGLLINELLQTPDIKKIRDLRYHVINNLASYRAEVISFDQAAKTAEIKVNGNIYQVTAKDQYDVLLDQLGFNLAGSTKISEIKAPMPGMVLKLFVGEGDTVTKGDNLFVLEAMKMENMIKAPADVNIKAIKIKPGDKVEKGQVLMVF